MSIFQPHNAFTFKSKNRLPCLITSVRISLPSTVEEIGNSTLQMREYKGLWDTGASSTVITEKIVSEMGLQSIGKVDVNHANGTSTRDKFLVNVILPNNVVIASVTVVTGILTDFDVLVGMDIITLGDFSLTNKNGETTMSFRIPSCKEVDYVIESNEYNSAMTSGNKQVRERFTALYK